MAFIIDEGIVHSLLKEVKFYTSEAARTMVLTLPKILNEQSLHIINTYAPPSSNDKAGYVAQLISFLNQNQYTPQNSIIVGDLNDYVCSELDYWSNKKSSANKQLGTILNPQKDEIF